MKNIKSTKTILKKTKKKTILGKKWNKNNVRKAKAKFSTNSILKK
jgi:hypothetical protein